ncbi:MAG: RNA methyltransferase [bacterium]|nr:RNA methyltransferase [bacterium]
MMYAILHNIRSLHNVGSMFRTADAAGVEKLYLCGITGTPPRSEIAKVALGAEQTVAWEYVRRTGDVIKRLRRQGVHIVALEKTKTSVDYRDFSTTPNPSLKGRGEDFALLVGNEVEGLPPLLLRLADTVVHIPMRGKKESLNVSVAFGIMAYHLTLKS